MQYALLIYNPDDDIANQPQRPITPGIAAVLARPDVTGWIRLHAPGSATTVSHSESRTLLTDGPFVDSKEFPTGSRSSRSTTSSPGRPAPQSWK